MLDFGEQGGRLARVTAAVTLACLLLAQDLTVAPARTEVGAEVVVTVRRGDAPAASVPVVVEFPDGSRRELGETDAGGRLGFEPDRDGMHALRATVDGVRCVTPLAVAPARRRWLLAFGSVPLGLVLLWLHLRRPPGHPATPGEGRSGAPKRAAGVDQASTRST